jgi:hypothetical protein
VTSAPDTTTTAVARELTTAERAEVLPAIRREPTSLDDYRLDGLARVGEWLALSESGELSLPARAAAAALRLYYASELGLTPMAAAELTVIGGRLFVGAALLRALARRAGYRVTRPETSDTTCTAQIASLATGEVLGEATFTFADAQRAGLVRGERSAWSTHPARMLWARASKNVIIDFAPEVALGIELDDELHELTASGTIPAAPAAPAPAAPAALAMLDEAGEAELAQVIQRAWPGIDGYRFVIKIPGNLGLDGVPDICGRVITGLAEWQRRASGTGSIRAQDDEPPKGPDTITTNAEVAQ